MEGLRRFFWGLTRSRSIARAVGVLSGLIMRPFGYLMSAKSLFDGPSGTFFLGKRSDKRMKHRDVVELYKGGMQ